MEDFLGHVILVNGETKITVWKIIMACLTMGVTVLFFKGLKSFMEKKFGSLAPENYAKFKTLYKIVKYIVYVVVILAILRSFGINIDMLLAGSAALFVGLGMGMQQFFMDFISGIMILFDETLAAGDIIQIEDQVGRVEQINFRTTVMITRDDRVVIIPNHKFLSEYLYNWTQNSDITRFHLSVGVAYGSDTKLVADLLKKVAMEHPHVENRPDPVIIFSEFGDNSLNFQLYFYTDQPLQSPKIKSDLRFMIDKEFRAHNVSIPFPQRDLHIISPSASDSDHRINF
ncbi:putative MscS family protein [Flavobacteriaceae bacterium UJ101]|nr:putative MscS family protein [Flavobacteriaceae bacterium UJ101]